MPAPVSPGTVIASCRIEALVGEGATGSVYLAEDLGTGRRVALKLLAPELACDDRFRQRFLRETGIAATLEHPNIVATLASGEENGLLYLAMPYVEGVDLRDLLRRQAPLETAVAVDLVAQVAAALDAAHDADLVHRDVKPGNILVAASGEETRAYLCDFGLARHVTSASSLTGDRGFVGTIDYVSPEQIRGAGVGAPADVYSLGCVLFECLTGDRPFERESELAVVFAHLNEEPPRVTELRPELPAAFDAVVATALSKSPEGRYESCGDLARAARGALRGATLRPRRSARTRIPVAVALGLGATAVAFGLWSLVGGERGGGRPPAAVPRVLRPNTLNLVRARTGRLVARIGYGAGASAAPPGVDVAFSARSAWVLLLGDARLVRVDLATRKRTGAVLLPWRPAGIVTGGGAVWVAQEDGPEVWAVDAATAKMRRTFSIGDQGGGIAYGAGSLWLTRDARVVRVDPRSGRVLASVPTPGQARAVRRLVFADGSLWLVGPATGLVQKIDPIQNKVSAQAKLHSWVSDVAVGGGFLWAAIVPDGVVYKLTEDDLSVQGTVPAGADPERISVGGGKLWIANAAANAVSAVDQASGSWRRLAVGAEPRTAAYHEGVVWAAAAPSSRPVPQLSGQELRISTPAESFNDDPAHAGLGDEQIWDSLCANLLNYRDSPGGARLAPEIAESMPSVSRDGRTYTFRVRRGFRFSPPSHEPVTAETFRHTIERTLAPGQQHAWPLADDIAGAPAYSAGTAAHIAGISVHGNRLSITLSRPAGDFLTRISMPSFCPVPLAEPVEPRGPAIASAGPYYVAAPQTDRTVLLRNPNYAGNRPRRPARIVFTSFVPTPEAVARADRGAVDYLPAEFDDHSLLAPGGTLDRRYGPWSAAARAGRQRYFRRPLPFLEVVVLNTRRPLFRDGRLRRAVSFALDRRALAAAAHDEATAGLIPPTVPGYRAARVYPVAGPDLGAARRLAGTRARRAVLYLCGDPAQRSVAAILRSNLARIRIAVSFLESERCLEGPDPARNRADLVLEGIGLGSADRDPAPFFDMTLGGAYGFQHLGPGPWDARGFRERLERARALRGAARVGAYTRLERELLRAAPVAVYGALAAGSYFSPYVGCKVVRRPYGFIDLGALCVRRR